MNQFINRLIYRGIHIILIGLAIVTLTGCHSSRKTAKKNKPKVETVRIRKNLHGSEKRLVEEALSWQGTPYRYGGSEKGRGTDCSGLVLKVYEDVMKIKMPRNSAKQAEFCKKIKEASVKPGDLVFFATGKNPDAISHVGIMIDDRQFVHASTKKGVIVSDVTTPYYKRTFKMYGRVPL